MQESLEALSHGIPEARTRPQPDKMWRTKAVEIKHLTLSAADIYTRSLTIVN